MRMWEKTRWREGGKEEPRTLCPSSNNTDEQKPTATFSIPTSKSSNPTLFFGSPKKGPSYHHVFIYMYSPQASLPKLKLIRAGKTPTWLGLVVPHLQHPPQHLNPPENADPSKEKKSNPPPSRPTTTKVNSVQHHNFNILQININGIHVKHE